MPLCTTNVAAAMRASRRLMLDHCKCFRKMLAHLGSSCHRPEAVAKRTINNQHPTSNTQQTTLNAQQTANQPLQTTHKPSVILQSNNVSPPFRSVRDSRGRLCCPDACVVHHARDVADFFICCTSPISSSSSLVSGKQPALSYDNRLHRSRRY